MPTAVPASDRAADQHRRRTDPPNGRAKRTTVAGVGVVLACAVACSLPLLVAAGGVASVGAFLSGGRAIGVVLLVAAAGGLIVWATRRRRAPAMATASGESCDCDGC